MDKQKESSLLLAIRSSFMCTLEWTNINTSRYIPPQRPCPTDTIFKRLRSFVENKYSTPTQVTAQ